MKRDYSNLFDEIVGVWRRQPCCSIQLLTPKGCGGAATRSIAETIVTREHLGLAHDLRVVPFRLSSDGAETSDGFVEKIVQRCEGLSGFRSQSVPAFQAGSASGRLESLIAYLHELKVYPVLLIDRFHAFAGLKDGGSRFLLASMRDLEIDGNLTTINVTPLRYSDLRMRLAATGGFPFINSDYGDYHQTVMLPPIGRKEFVDMAPAQAQALAHKLYPHTAGIDPLVGKVIDKLSDTTVIFDSVVAELDDSASDLLNGFIEYFTYAPFKDNAETLAQLAIEQLSPVNEQVVRSHPFRSYFLKSNEGHLGIASRVLALAAIRANPDQSLLDIANAIMGRNWGGASFLLSAYSGSTKVKHIRELLDLLEALSSLGRSGVLDLAQVMAAARKLNEFNGDVPVICRRVKDRVNQWVSALDRCGVKNINSLEDLTVLGADADLVDLLVYTFGERLDWCQAQFPSDQGMRLANAIPESILQTMLSIFEVDFTNPPEFPILNYSDYWPLEGSFNIPEPGKKLALLNLYVVTAAFANTVSATKEVPDIFREPVKVKATISTLVNLKNPTSHTYKVMSAQQSKKFFDICAEMFSKFCEFTKSEYVVVASEIDVLEALFGSSYEGGARSSEFQV